MEQLEIVNEQCIKFICNIINNLSLTDNKNFLNILITIKPTVPHCSFLPIIGLAIRYKIDLEFRKICNYKLDIKIKEKYHYQVEECKLFINCYIKQMINN